MKKLFREIIVEIEIKTILIALLFLISVFLFGYLAHEVVGENESGFDNKVFHFFGASYFSIPAYIILLIILFISGRKTDGINIAIVAITSTALMFGLKEYFHRKRPDLPVIRSLHNYSFPSGHALSSFIFCSVLIYLVWKGS